MTQQLEPLLPIVVIGGPTASGKTALAVEVALELDSEIVSADSRQIYRHMDIATAKPTSIEMKGVKHHALDLIEPDASFSAGAFARLAYEKMEELWQKNKIPVLAGGSGMYIKAVIEGLFEDPFDYGAIRVELQEELQQKGPEFLYAELADLDPVAALRLDRGDSQRLLRALEIARARIGSRATEYKGMHRAWDSGSNQNVLPVFFAIDHDRSTLYRRINQRAAGMWSGGLLDEIGRLERLGYDETSCAMKTMGYEEGWACHKGQIAPEAALEKIQRRTRQYAKRQMTWFRGDRRARWLDPDRGGLKGMVKRVLAQTLYLAEECR